MPTASYVRELSYKTCHSPETCPYKDTFPTGLWLPAAVDFLELLDHKSHLQVCSMSAAMLSHYGGTNIAEEITVVYSEKQPQKNPLEPLTQFSWDH